MKGIFWNPEEQRMRAGWRLLVFALLGLLATLPAGFIQAAEVGSLYTRMAVAYGAWTLLLLAVAWFQARFIDRRPFAEYGLTRGPGWGLQLALGVLIGTAMIGLVFGVELAAGWIRLKPAAARAASEFHASDLAFQLILFASVALGEEITYRGCVLKNLAEGLNPGRHPSAVATLGACGLAAVLFGLFHAGNDNASAIAILNIGLVGVFLGLCLLWTRSLAIPMGVHFGWNFFQGPVFGFPVSGENMGQTVLDLAQGGPVVMTGGTFGPEGGLLSTGSTLLGIGAVALWVRYREGALRVHAELACPPETPGKPLTSAMTPTSSEP
ncbi:MAG: hypothetical protein RIS76_849 [Verrucomicrobiota bacterium]|jgi:membrane protease YdiL (CAAX protease family)